jgi:tetratricopeptide (TPR) repeat protein
MIMNKAKAIWSCALIGLCVLPATAVAQQPSPAAERVIAAQRQITARPDAPENYEAYNELALQLTRRARETADPVYYDRAEEAIRRSLELNPGNLDAQKMAIWVLLGKHQFGPALELARSLNKRIPDDLQVYGFLVDAHVELGNYKEAEEACQWMLDLRPGSVPAFTRASYLRELFGDFEGSIELMRAAYQRTPAAEVEDRAWILTQLGHLEMSAGRIEDADRVLQEALQVFPGYHYALANLAKVRAAQGKPSDSIELLKRRYEAAPHPENLYELAEALARAGRQSEADTAYAEFETRALREAESWDNANRELVFYYADRARKPEQALRIARMEVARRQDVHTLDAYAWALHVSDDHRQASESINRALAVGTKDAAMLARARVIAAQENQKP